MINLKNLALLLLLAFPGLSEARSDTTYFYAANWNLQNLFDTLKDKDKNDGDFLPDGPMHWTGERMKTKLGNIARVIEFMNQGHGPDLLGVEEVEHKSLLKSIIEDYMKDDRYEISYAESPDNRGIDNGLIFNKKIFKLEKVNTITVNLADGWPTRYILESDFVYRGKPLYVFVNHWPSRSGGAEKSEANRDSAASALKRRTSELLKANKNADIIVIGDFNDDPSNRSITKVLDAEEMDGGSSPDSLLINLSYESFKKGLGSFLYRDSWNMLDQMIVSKGLFADSPVRYSPESFEVIKPEFMVTKSGKFKGSAFPTYGGKRYLGGYSDHFPVGARFFSLN